MLCPVRMLALLQVNIGFIQPKGISKFRDKRVASFIRKL